MCRYLNTTDHRLPYHSRQYYLFCGLGDSIMMVTMVAARIAVSRLALQIFQQRRPMYVGRTQSFLVLDV